MSRSILLLGVVAAMFASSAAAQDDTTPDTPIEHVDTIPDPVAAFVRGFNPAEEDFFAHPAERTWLLRMRLDVDGDGRGDLAVSESSVFGSGGGPWLVFRRLPRAGYRYIGEIFAGEGSVRAERRGAVRDLAAGTALSADVTHLVRYHVGLDTLVAFEERDTSAAAIGSPETVLERCRLTDYRRLAEKCWQPGAAPE
jgi:hypothetical protein